MRRFCYLAMLMMLMMLSSSAHAGNSFSFTVAGHHIQIESPRNCDSASCISVSIPGIYGPAAVASAMTITIVTLRKNWLRR